MELYDHIRKISFIFFAILGLAHFLAGLFFVNGYLHETAGLMNRILFIPFVIAALTYTMSNMKYHLVEYGRTGKAWDYTFAAFGIIIFIGLIMIEFLIVDSKTPLLPP